MGPDAPAFRHGLVAVLLLFAGGSSLRAAELFAPSPVDEVSVRRLPSFTVLETEFTGTVAAGWDKGYRLGARYGVHAGSGLNTPTIITFIDWEKNPTAEGDEVHFLVQCLLDPLPGYPHVRDPGASLRDMPAMTVACFAQSGEYSPEAFQHGLGKIMAYLKSRHVPQVGPPRYLYYVTTNWMPSWWRIGEVQVPIAPGTGT
jgi:hypothetical protein